MPSGLKTRDGARLGDFVPFGIGDRTRVAELGGRRRAFGVHRVGELPQPAADVGLVERHLVSVGAPGARHRAVRDGGHAHATRREPVGGTR